jgi:polyribonucleotide nucleotidyltransferase
MITVECIIPQKHHRTVMGAKGRKVQSITSEYDVQIKFPDRDVYGKYQFFLHVKMQNC